MDIAALIRSTKAGRSYDRLAADCGAHLTAARLQQIATKTPREFPEPATIRALAQGLRVRERQVVLAWAESLGLTVDERDSRLAQLLPPTAAELADDQTAAILAVVHAMTPREGVAHATPTTPGPDGPAPAGFDAVTAPPVVAPLVPERRSAERPRRARGRPSHP